ncbi:MAG: FmdB family zinc ribbon protein [Anaerolineae bacterium]|jgi:putative FmdB family regulatory protein
MPIYEYKCPKCGHPFEKLVSFSAADEPQACPSCGFERSTKKISMFASHGGGSSGAPAPAAACGPVG